MKLPKFNEVMKNGARVLAAAPAKSDPENSGIALSIYEDKLSVWRIWENPNHEDLNENEWLCWPVADFGGTELATALKCFEDRCETGS